MCKPRDIAFTGVHRQRRATGEGIVERRKLSKLEQGTAVAVDVIIRFMKCNPTHLSCRIYVLAEIFSRIFFSFQCTSMDTKTTTLLPSFQSSD